MIFVTVGTQLPFDRLLKAVDEWARANQCDERIIAQVGPSDFVSPRMEISQFVSPSDLKETVRSCRLVVSHAGIGSILTALTYQTPIIIVPRLASLGEHRNDHQVATVDRFGDRAGVAVASSGEQLIKQLNFASELQCGSEIKPFASLELINTIRSFIQVDAPATSSTTSSQGGNSFSNDHPRASSAIR